MIITIDGPAGAGKSSAAKLLAQRLGFEFLEHGRDVPGGKRSPHNVPRSM